MAPEELRNAVTRSPFEPFRIYLTDGAKYEIRHPDLVMVGRRSVVIGFTTRSPAEPRPIYDRYTTVDPLHIVRMEPIEAMSPS
jgi:hypothetical protein